MCSIWVSSQSLTEETVVWGLETSDLSPRQLVPRSGLDLATPGYTVSRKRNPKLYTSIYQQKDQYIIQVIYYSDLSLKPYLVLDK